MNLEKFLRKFEFRENLAGFVGIERERFLCCEGIIVPRSHIFLKNVSSNWTYELSNCQVEDRTKPKRRIEEVEQQLIDNDREGKREARLLGLDLLSMEVGPSNMSLKVYPNSRYLKIVKSLSLEKISAACRVTGTHIHIGMPNIETAIRVNNLLREKDIFNRLCWVGDHSKGERLNLYRLVAGNCYPSYYKDKNHFFEVAKKKGFADNPRNCWDLIRISVHGTIELRMFGSTSNIDEILSWVQLIRIALKNRGLVPKILCDVYS